MAGVEAADDDAIAVRASQVAALASSERELRRHLSEAHEQIGARDEQIRRLIEELARGRAEHERLLGEAAAAHSELAALRATRVVRGARLWWRLRHRLRSG